jgi:hypothetical protein
MDAGRVRSPGPKSADGSAHLIAESSALTKTPDALEITLEASGGSQVPTGQVMLARSAP